MRSTPGACVKPGCLARWPLCHKVNLPASSEARRPALCHKVNLPSCVARQPLFHKAKPRRVCAKFGFRCEASFCQQVDDWMLLKITEKIIQRNVFERNPS